MLVAFRGLSVGTDTLQYENIYTFIANSKFNFSLDMCSAPLYYTVNYVIGHFFQNGLCLRLIQACITYFCLYKLISKNHVNGFLALCLFVGDGWLACTMNISRQMLAISIALYSAYLYTIEKRSLLSILLFVSATLIHVSSLVIVVIILIKPIFSNKNDILVVFVSSVILALIINSVFKYIIIIFSYYLQHYKSYTEKGQFLNLFEHKTSGNFFFVYLFYLSLVVTYVIKIKNRRYCFNKFSCVIIPFLTISMIIGLLNQFNELLYRFLIPSFVLFSLIFIPNLIDNLSYKERSIFLPIIILYTVLFFYIH